MNIKKIIREELEGLKNSSAEDWEWTEDALSMGNPTGSVSHCGELDIGTNVLVTSNYQNIGAEMEIGVVVEIDDDSYAVKFNNRFDNKLHGDETREYDTTRSTWWFECGALSMERDTVYKY